MLEIIKIDSFKLRIPLRAVKIVCTKFGKKYHKIYKETGEVDETHTNLDKHIIDSTNGINTRMGIVHSVDFEGGGEFFMFQINAKMLGKKYFEGINRRNLKIIYKHLMSFKIVEVTKQNFLDGLVSDIDYCFDYSITREAMIESNNFLYTKILDYCYRYVSKPFKRKNNVGIQFNDRSKATPSKPYCKIYHKTTELENKSFEFADHFLKKVDYQNIGRYEFTIKNSKHKKYINLQDCKTLDDFLRLPQKRLEKFFFNGLKLYTMKETIVRDLKELSPTDILIVELINRLISRGSDKQNIYSILHVYESAQVKSRIKKKLDILINNVDDEYRMKANEEAMNMMRVLRLDL